MATAGEGRGRGPERAFCAPLPPEGAVVLTPDESRHLVRSRRVRAGEVVVLFDGKGGTVRGRLVEADPRRAVVDLLGPSPDREPPRPLRVAVSPPEASRADALVAGLADLGVSVLLPLLCARTPADRGALVSRRLSRWDRLAREAAKSNGRSRLLRVEAPRSFEETLPAVAPAAILLDPDPGCPPLPDRVPDRGPLPWLLVGPEGGFAPTEVEAAKRAGVVAARLGVVALRVETAAVAAAAVALAR